MLNLLRFTLVCLLFCCGQMRFAWAANAPWSIGTARTLPEGRLEVGVFQPLQYGLTSAVELSTQPLLNAVLQNAAVKVFWASLAGFEFASSHGLSSPTVLLRTLAREGIGGIWPADNKIPVFLQTDNQLLISFSLDDQHLATLQTGVSLALPIGEKVMATIDYPLVYARTAVLQTGYSFRVGVDFDGPLGGDFYYLADIDLFLLPGLAGKWAFEHSGMVTWQVSTGFVVQAGYKLSVGAFPFGIDWQMFPLVDLKWGFDL